MTTEAVTTGSGQLPSSEVKFNGNVARVTSIIVAANPVAGTESSHSFSRQDFENALDKVSRPVKGKYADVPYSSEDLIRDKRAEVELEDR